MSFHFDNTSMLYGFVVCINRNIINNEEIYIALITRWRWSRSRRRRRRIKNCLWMHMSANTTHRVHMTCMMETGEKYAYEYASLIANFSKSLSWQRFSFVRSFLFFFFFFLLLLCNEICTCTSSIRDITKYHRTEQSFTEIV